MEFANPLDAYIAEATLGRRKAVTTTMPCERSCERIATLLRRGITRGIGQTEWLLRTPVGIRFGQDKLDEIAGLVEEGFMRSPQPPEEAAADDEGQPTDADGSVADVTIADDYASWAIDPDQRWWIELRS